MPGRRLEPELARDLHEPARPVEAVDPAGRVVDLVAAVPHRLETLLVDRIHETDARQAGFAVAFTTPTDCPTPSVPSRDRARPARR